MSNMQRRNIKSIPQRKILLHRLYPKRLILSLSPFDISAWSRCNFKSYQVERLDWNIPKSKVKFLKNFEFEKHDPIIIERPEKEEEEAQPKKKVRRWKGVTKKPKKGKTTETKMQLTVKGGSAVHPDSGLQEKGHILTEKKNEMFNVTLSMSDVSVGMNSYPKKRGMDDKKKKDQIENLLFCKAKQQIFYLIFFLLC